MSSFIAAGTAYSTHGINMIPFFIYYSMFGFQRIGDLIWAAGRLPGQGLHDRRHRRPHHARRRRPAAPGRPQPAQRHRPFPPCGPTTRPSPTRPPTIVLDGMQRMYEEGEDAIYYITVDNENYRHAADARRASKKASSAASTSSRPRTPATNSPHVQLFGSGAILREALRAQEILAEKYGVSSNVWSVTSYTELARDAQAAERWNMLHPDRDAARSRTSNKCSPARTGRSSPPRTTCGPLAEQISPWVPGGLFAAGHRRLRPQRDRDRICGGISRSTPSASPWPRSINLSKRGQVDSQVRGRRRSRIWASIRKRSIR